MRRVQSDDETRTAKAPATINAIYAVAQVYPTGACPIQGSKVREFIPPTIDHFLLQSFVLGLVEVSAVLFFLQTQMD